MQFQDFQSFRTYCTICTQRPSNIVKISRHTLPPKKHSKNVRALLIALLAPEDKMNIVVCKCNLWHIQTMTNLIWPLVLLWCEEPKRGYLSIYIYSNHGGYLYSIYYYYFGMCTVYKSWNWSKSVRMEERIINKI